MYYSIDIPTFVQLGRLRRWGLFGGKMKKLNLYIAGVIIATVLSPTLVFASVWEITNIVGDSPTMGRYNSLALTVLIIPT